MRVCIYIWAICLFAGTAVSGKDKSYEVFEMMTASSPSDSRSKEWKPGDGISLEVSGMEWMGDGRLAVCVRKGEVWLIDNALSDDREKIDDPEEGEDVGAHILHTPESHHVLEGEQDRERPLEGDELRPVSTTEAGDGVQHHSCDTGDDEDDQSGVEVTAPSRLVAEDDLVRLASERVGGRSGIQCGHQPFSRRSRFSSGGNGSK